MKVKRIGNIYGFTGGSYAGAVYDPEGIGPSIDTMSGGNRQPMIVAMRGRNPDNPSDRRGGIPLEQRLEPNQEGICNCLTQLYKDNLVMETVKAIDEQNMCIRNETFGTIQTDGSSPKHNNRVLIKQATKQGYAECELGGVADLSYPDSTTRRGRVQEGGNVSPALTVTDMGNISRIEKVGQISNDGSQYGTVVSDKGLAPTLAAGTHGYANSCIESKYRIRKLTPLECWRLMGFTDEEFKAAETVNSNTQLYKQAGNSIVVDVLVGIFRNIIDSMEVEDMETKEALVEVVKTDKMIDLAKFREAEPELFEELVADYPGTKGNYLFCVGE